MKKIITVSLLFILLMLTGCSKQIDIEAEKTNVKAVLDLLIEASENEDMELLEVIYSDDQEMIIFGTEADERIVGWDNLKELMQQQFDSTSNSKLVVSDQVIRVGKFGETAWFSEIIDWNLEFGGEAVSLKGLRATGVLQKTADKWKIVQLHYSIPAVN